MSFECHCDCHPEENVMHCMPCCDGECPHCGRNFIDLKEHIAEDHPEPDFGPDAADFNLQEQTERFVKVYGERHRKLILDSLTFAKQSRNHWGVRIGLRKYMREVMSRVS